MLGGRVCSQPGGLELVTSLGLYLRDPTRSFHSFCRDPENFFLVLLAYCTQHISGRHCDYALYKRAIDIDIDTDSS